MSKLDDKYKRLCNQYNLVSDEIILLKAKAADITTEIVEVKKQIEEENRYAQKLIVTEHALLRYLQRVLDLDMNAVVDSIANKELFELVKENGGSGTFHDKGYELRISDYKIVTIIKKAP